MTNPNDPVACLTKREEFAKAAMEGNLANSYVMSELTAACKSVEEIRRLIAEGSCQMADALIAQLNK